MVKGILGPNILFRARVEETWLNNKNLGGSSCSGCPGKCWYSLMFQMDVLLSTCDRVGVNCLYTLCVCLKIAPGGWMGEWSGRQEEPRGLPGLHMLEIKRSNLPKLKEWPRFELSIRRSQIIEQKEER